MDPSSYFVALIIWAILGIIPGLIARNKGYSFWIWWFFGASFFIIALPMAILIKSSAKEIEEQKVKSGDYTKCPHCAELIKQEAKICKHCGRAVPQTKPASEEDSLFCSWCGIAIDSDNLFCGNCGVQLIQLGNIHTRSRKLAKKVSTGHPDWIACSICDAKQDSSSTKWCVQCGSRFSQREFIIREKAEEARQAANFKMVLPVVLMGIVFLVLAIALSIFAMLKGSI